MKVLDLFSGIGGFSLGLERAGMTTVAFCEIEKFPRKVLNKHWPEVPIYDDIRKLTAEMLKADGIGAIDVVCGGFPCQPFSQAGKRKGKADDRDLWPEMFRVIQETRPTWVIGENVAGFVNMELERSITDLESEGYEVEALLIPACGVDAQHRRERVWIIAHAAVRKNRGSVEPEIFPNTGTGSQSEAISNSNSAGQRERWGAEPVQAELSAIEYDCEKGWSNWPVEPDLGRVAHGIPRRVDRLRGLGNAVVLQVVEAIGRAIMEATK